MTEKSAHLIDDCFAFDDRNRMRHDAVLAAFDQRLTCVVGTQTVPLAKAHGRILASDMTALRDSPPVDNAAVDGWAFRHADYSKGKPLQQVARIAAGDPVLDTLSGGCCARIFTGASMPVSADTVAMQEDCTDDHGTIAIPPGLKPGANRRKAGEDVKTGDVLVAAGNVLRPADIAAAAASGIASLTTRKQLRIGLLSTGDAIIQPGQSAHTGQIYDANRPMLAALLEHPIIALRDLGHVRDDAARIRETIETASRDCELIVTSGGASRGEEDHLFSVMQELGKAHVWQIAVKPGRPMLFGQIGDSVLMALPGNPVAVMVCFLLYGWPVIARLTGANRPDPVGYRLPAGFSVPRKKPDRREFWRGWRETDPETGQTVLRKYSRDGSGLISGLRAAEGLIVIDEETTSVKEGDRLTFVPFSDYRL